jgi:putative endonuclease
MCNKRFTTLYIGVTNNLEQRVLQHKTGNVSSFTNKYNIQCLLYYEELTDVSNAIKREKQLKNWHRDWKWNFIKSQNPDLVDLAKDWYDEETLK